MPDTVSPSVMGCTSASGLKCFGGSQSCAAAHYKGQTYQGHDVLVCAITLVLQQGINLFKFSLSLMPQCSVTTVALNQDIQMQLFDTLPTDWLLIRFAGCQFGIKELLLLLLL